jgi:uncharacterized membrane protein YkgB
VRVRDESAQGDKCPKLSSKNKSTLVSKETGYIQIIVGIPFFVGMQKEAVNTILNIVKFTTTPHNI